MSEAIRSYDGNKAGLGLGAPSRGPRRSPYVSVVLFFVLLACGVWLTRDAYDIEAFLPAHKTLQIRMEQAVGSRKAIGASPVWALLPDDGAAGTLRDAFREPLPVPEWLAKNLFNQQVFWFGDMRDGEGVVVSRMTRVGTAVARLGRFLPGVERDWAGGLNLKSLPDPGLYFAVRGRILIAGTSRDAVIESLTLSETDRAVLDGFLVNAPEKARLSGVIMFPEEEAERFGADRVEFGVIADGQRIALVARGELSGGSSPFASLLRECRPQTLHAPYDAPAALVVSAGLPLRELTIALGEAAGSGWPDAAQWEAWSAPPDTERDRPGVAGLLGQFGPEIHLTLHGVDADEVLPAPELVVAAPGAEDSLLQAIAAFPAPRPGPSLDAVRASYDPAAGLLRVPGPGGDSLEPSASLHGDRLVFSTSLNRLHALLTEAPTTRTLPGANNAYLRVRPGQVVELLATAGAVLAENGLLEDYTEATFAEQVAEWREDAATIEAVEAALRSDGAVVSLECEIRFRK